MFISIDGTDGAGKATQTKLLAERVRAAGREAAVLSFPRYDTPVGAAIKRLLTGERHIIKAGSVESVSITAGASATMYETDDEDEALILQSLFLTDKADAITEIVDHLNDGTVVICDRWIESALCYGPADGLDPDWLERIHFPMLNADLSIFLDVSPQEALRRRPEARDRFERDREKQARVYANYLDLWKCDVGGLTIVQSDPYQYYARVDGEGTIEEVTDRLFKEVVKVPTWTEEIEHVAEKGPAS